MLDPAVRPTTINLVRREDRALPGSNPSARPDAGTRPGASSERRLHVFKPKPCSGHKALNPPCEFRSAFPPTQTTHRSDICLYLPDKPAGGDGRVGNPSYISRQRREGNATDPAAYAARLACQSRSPAGQAGEGSHEQ
jgi:hypothetical protein